MMFSWEEWEGDNEGGESSTFIGGHKYVVNIHMFLLHMSMQVT